LKVLVHMSFKEGRGYYRSPRAHDDLVEWHEHVSRKHLIRLMQDEGLKARVRKRYKVTTDSNHESAGMGTFGDRNLDAPGAEPSQQLLRRDRLIRAGAHPG
jgi:hypothetical protein